MKQTDFSRRAALTLLPAWAAMAALSTAAGMALPAAAWAQAPDLLAKARAAGVIRIANTQSSPPWSLIDDRNQPAGYDVDVAREVARRMGIAQVVFVADSYKNFVEGLRVGKYDVVMNDLTPTPERSKQIDFAAPYGVEDFRIFVRADSADIRGRADLRGKRVGVTTGTTNETWSRDNLKEADIRAYDNGGFVYADLKNRRLDAVISSQFGGLKYAAASRMPVRMVGEPLVYQLSAPALAKGQPALRAALSKAVESMVADGTVDRLAKKWLGEHYDMSGTIAKAQRQ